MATIVTYNGVELHNIHTRQWSEEVAYDSSGVDSIGQRFKLRFEGILHAQRGSPGGDLTLAPAWIAPLGALAPVDAVSNYAAVRKLLSQPRKRLEVTIGGQSVLVCEPCDLVDSPDRDTDNGPHPQDVQILHIAGQNVFRLSFTIQCTKLECPTKGGPVPYILNNRWSLSETMDDSWYMTRTIRGRLRISTSDLPAEVEKPVVVPFLERGFRRDSLEYTVAANGLDVDYTVTDRQIANAAPWPATKMDVTFGESTGDGITFFSEIGARLEGPPNVDRRFLIQRAVQIADARLNFQKMKGGNDYFPEQCSIVEHVGEKNIVELRFRIRHKWDTPIDALAHLRTDVLGKDLKLPDLQGHAYDREKSDMPWPHGYDLKGERDPAVTLLLRCYLQKPCEDRHEIGNAPDNPISSAADLTATPTAPPQTSVSGTKIEGELPQLNDPPAYSPETMKATYLLAKMQATYLTRHCRVQLPLATAGIDPKAATSTTVTLGPPQCRLEFSTDAERVGEPPATPSPLDEIQVGDVKGTLLKHWVKMLPPALAPDGVQQIYRLSAYYLYSLSRQPLVDEALFVGSLPYTRYLPADTALTGQQIYSTERAPAPAG